MRRKMFVRLMLLGVLSSIVMIFCAGAASIDASPNHPISFGYKTAWYAVRSCDPQKVATTLGLTDIRSVTWEAGFNAIAKEEDTFINSSDLKTTFVSPPVNGWTLAVGLALLKNANAHSSQIPTKMLKRLSEVCHEAQFYASYRIVDAYTWSRAKNGAIIRAYEYVGSEGETLTNIGPTTLAERGINFEFPDEDDVLKVAGAWSVDPSKLDETISTPLGLLGEIHGAQ
jgi:hypothetical protein